MSGRLVGRPSWLRDRDGGFVVLEGWSVEDALYQTVTTLTTVGFREVHELDTVGRIWAMVVAIAGVAIIFGSIGIVSEYLVDEVATGDARRGP